MTRDTIDRHFISVLDEALETTRIVNLTGPRQVGKTTLVRDLYDKGDYHTLDDKVFFNAVEDDPMGLLLSLAEDAKQRGRAVIIDEAQQSKDIALALKRIVDMDRRRGQFILTGPSNIFALPGAADTLVGRQLTIRLWPLTAAEINGAEPNRLLEWASEETPSLSRIALPGRIGRKDYINLILKGGFPGALQLDPHVRQNAYLGYIDSMMTRDITDLFKIRKAAVLRKLVQQMAIRTGREFNVSSLSRGLGVARDTIDTYLSILEHSSVVLKLDAWRSNESLREIKQPKYHFVDSGMNCALRRLDSSSFGIGGNYTNHLGGLMESWVANELVRALPLLGNRFHLHHWRSPDRREIDIIADAGETIVGIEVKASPTITGDDLKHLKWFAKEGPGRARRFTGLVLYLGEHKLSFGDNCFALPASSLWAEIDF